MTLDGGAIVTMVIFMIVHLCGFIWWASKIETTLGFIRSEVEKLSKNSEKNVSLIDHAKDIAHVEKEIDAIWKRLNEPHACPNGNVCKK